MLLQWFFLDPAQVIRQKTAMPSLKELKNRITSVKSTRKITSAMKMVAGSKLRRAQEAAEAARPYELRMARILSSLAGNLVITDTTPRLLAGTGKDKNVLLLVLTSDRGLCGAFNSSVVREARKMIRQFESEGKTVTLFCIGRKGRDMLRRDHAAKIIYAPDQVTSGKRVSFDDANKVGAKLVELFDSGTFDICHLVFNKFKSVMSQIVTAQQLVPFAVPKNAAPVEGIHATYDFEPEEDIILQTLLPRALSVALYGAMLESAAGEQGARMTAMDNATRNAGDMITKLTLNYNRSRQAYITKELIEIISGAEAV
jgi:F-type H+-transporting ATPase subunit gamma